MVTMKLQKYYCCVYKMYEITSGQYIQYIININQYHLLCLTSRISGPPTFATYLEDSLQQQPPANLLIKITRMISEVSQVVSN